MVGVLHVYLLPSQAEAIECAQITKKPWKSQLRKKIRPSKRILASTIDRTHQRDFSLCNSRRIVPIQSHPFRVKNSLSTFQPFINKDITDLEDCETYIDDVIIFSDTWGKKP